jgi:hypothetical protein
MARQIESFYGENRGVTTERPLVLSTFYRPEDTTVVYDKGGWVFWMLTQRMGHEYALTGMREFIAKFRGGEDHAALEDFTAHMRAYAPDTAAYDDFVRQWFDTVVVPEYKVDSAITRVVTDGEWETEVVVRNVGTGRMPLEVGVVRGERFPDDTTKSKAKPYGQAVALTTLGPKEKATVTIRSPFEPEKVVVDPDVKVLQLRRKLAELSVTKR